MKNGDKTYKSKVNVRVEPRLASLYVAVDVSTEQKQKRLRVYLLVGVALGVLALLLASFIGLLVAGLVYAAVFVAAVIHPPPVQEALIEPASFLTARPALYYSGRITRKYGFPVEQVWQQNSKIIVEGQGRRVVIFQRLSEEQAAYIVDVIHQYLKLDAVEGEFVEPDDEVPLMIEDDAISVKRKGL
jgi:hypothetical protein